MPEGLNSRRSFRILLAVVAGSLVAMMLILVGLAGLFHWFYQRRPGPSLNSFLGSLYRLNKPLEIDSGQAYLKYRMEKKKELSRYQWISNSGDVQIPIEKAMRRWVEHPNESAKAVIKIKSGAEEGPR